MLDLTYDKPPYNIYAPHVLQEMLAMMVRKNGRAVVEDSMFWAVFECNYMVFEIFLAVNGFTSVRTQYYETIIINLNTMPEVPTTAHLNVK